MSGCNVILGAIAILIALYWCDLWILDDKCLSSLESFQVAAGKRFHHFYSSTRNISRFYGLGWVKLQRYIQAKNLLFIRFIFAMNNAGLQKICFVNVPDNIVCN